jgi:hypothetical protein
MWWIVQEHKVWKGIDPVKPCWASRGFVSSERESMQDIVDYIEGHDKDIILRVVKVQP